MRNARIFGVLGEAALLTTVAISACVRESERKLAAKPTPGAASDEIESGVYGFSGALKGGSPSGVIGECIWIYDVENEKQIAKGDCDEGDFRVLLKPGSPMLGRKTRPRLFFRFAAGCHGKAIRPPPGRNFQ
jgi:hypothetical protein